MNKKVIFVLSFLLLLFGWLTLTSLPATGDNPSPSVAVSSVTDCIVQPHGILGSVICAGQIIQQVPLPVTTIRPAPVRITLPVRTITLAPILPTVTKTIYEVTAPQTVFVTPPAKTIFVQRNITAPEVVITRTASPLPLPAATVTVTPTGGQSAHERGRIVPGGIQIPFTENATPIVKVGLGLLSALVLLGLILLGTYLGYTIGWKDKERKDTNFMRALLEQSTLRKK